MVVKGFLYRGISDRPRPTPFVFSLIACTLATSLFPARAELYFNVDALHLSEEQKLRLDLALLSRLTNQPPGRYRVQLSVNQRNIGEETLDFIPCGEALCPEIPVTLLKELGIKIDAFPALQKLPEEAMLTDIAAYIPQATVEFHFDRRQLNFTLPQAALDKQVQGYIPPEKWQEGVPMLFTSYNLSGSEVKSHHGAAGGQFSSQYLNLRSGANLGPWRLRNYSYYSRTGSGTSSWRSLQSWLERDIRTLRARLVVGETASPGLVFDSFSFRGLALTSQDEMLPFSQRGYAPIIRGVAMTNATVEVRQNGNLLYQTFVPPGDFVINDLYATGTSGDLEITIREEDGSVRKSLQPFATPPVSLRQGRVNYSVTAGEYGNHAGAVGAVQQRFMQMEAIYGLLNNTSVYGGLIVAEDYQSMMTGIGQGLGVMGAISLDVTHAVTRFGNGDSSEGQSWRLRYSKQIETTDTTMTLAGYRFDTDGYYTFDEANNYYAFPGQALRNSLKNRAQLTLSQNIGGLGAVALSASQQAYWHHNGAKIRSVTSSWSKNFDGVTVNLSQSMNKSWRTGKTDNVVSASFSIPLGKWLTPQSASALYMNNRLSWSRAAGNSQTTTLSGTAPQSHNLSWSAAQARSQRGGKVNESTALSASLQGASSTVSLGYTNYYGQNQRVNWAARGAVVAHPYGVTLSQPLLEGSGYALVRAPGASNVGITNRSGTTTDSRGYAIVPSLAAYQENEIALDTSTLSDEIDLVNPVQKSVPTREALVVMDYQTRIGYRTFLKITYNGKPLPLGAVVSAGEISGIADEKGQVYLTGVPEKSDLLVSLPDNQQCKTAFNLHNGVAHNGIIMAELTCKN